MRDWKNRWTSLLPASLALALMFLASNRGVAQTMPAELENFLLVRIRFTNDEINDVKRGKAVAKILPSEKHEIAVFGIVLVRAPEDFFVQRFRDIESYKKSTNVPVVKKFSDPPSLEDLDQLEVDPQDFNSLKKCRVGKCDVKLPAEAIEYMHREVDWESPGAAQQVNQLARTALLEYVKRYLAGGNTALSEYNDKEKPLRIAEEFDSILQASPYIYDYVPEFYEYLRNYPQARLENVDNFIYWSKEKFGLKPVISVSHVSIYSPQPGITLIASKQLYASHYFEASLGLTVAVGLPESPEPAFYLLYLNRSRSDALRGGFSGLARGRVKSRTRDGAKETLERVKRSIENRYRASEPSGAKETNH